MRQIWVAAILGLGLAVGTAQYAPDWPTLILSVLLGLAVFAFVREFSRSSRLAKPERFVDARPADGKVDLQRLPGVDSRTNEIRPEIGQYVGSDVLSERPSSRLSNRFLLGRLAVFSVFVGRDGSTWPDREVDEAYQALERMGRWLEREAIRHEAPVNVDLIATYFVADDQTEERVELTPSFDAYQTVIDEVDADVKGLSSASRAVQGLGFADLADLIERIDPQAEADATVWVVHMLRSGRSSAVSTDRFRYPGVGVAICYARESACSGPLDGLPFVDPATLAHEILHLFGATDKYGTPIRSFPPQSVTSKDVMRLDESRLSRCRIDPLTATEIGWTPPTRERKRPSATRS